MKSVQPAFHRSSPLRFFLSVVVGAILLALAAAIAESHIQGQRYPGETDRVFFAALVSFALGCGLRVIFSSILSFKRPWFHLLLYGILLVALVFLGVDYVARAWIGTKAGVTTGPLLLGSLFGRALHGSWATPKNVPPPTANEKRK